MRSSQGLYRRPSGIYVSRIVVPLRLRGLVGRNEIHASTGQRDLGAAKLAALKLQLNWRERFVALDLERLTIRSPLLAGDGTITIENAARAIGISSEDLMGEMITDHARLFAYFQHLTGLQVPDIDAIPLDYDGRFLVDEVEATGIVVPVSGLYRLYDGRTALLQLISEGNCKVSVLLSTESSSAWFLDDEIRVSISQCVVLKSAVDRIRVRLASGLPTDMQLPAIPAVTRSDETGIAIYDPRTAKHGKKRFWVLFETCKADRAWKADHARRMETEASIFRELMDDPELGTIDRAMIRKYGELVAKLPPDIYQAKRRYKTNSLKELIDIAERDQLPRKSVDTVRAHIGRLSEIFGYGVEEGEMLNSNPAANYKRGEKNKAGKRAQDARDVFTDAELELIFSQSWFKSGYGEFTTKGWTTWRPLNYWLPLLGLFTGARINELSQLYLDDVRQAENDASVWYLDFNLDQSDKCDADENQEFIAKSLKTVNSIRVIPLHDCLINLGLPEYVATLRKSGHVRLFPELKGNPNKGYGKPAGKWFNEHFLGKKLGIVRDGTKTFHSFRHTFLTAIERLDASERSMAELAGHQRGTTQSMTRYAKDRSATEMKVLIQRLGFPSVGELGYFDSPKALMALKVAVKHKESVARAKRKG